MLTFPLTCLVIIILSRHGYTQDIETLSEQKILKVNGGVSANTTFYHADGISKRRDPFYWLVNANLNLNILGIIQAPFSMTLSQQDKNFRQPQPFNRFGISPRYKSVTAHLGHRSMQFSEYTLAGNMFFGAGVEVNSPESAVRITAMYGQLTKAVKRAAQQGLVFAKPSYKRNGFGVKIGLGRKKNMVDLIFFKAKDDASSIAITDSVDLAPEDNFVSAIHGRHELTEKIMLEYEYAYSLLTRDTRAVETNTPNYSFFNNLGGIFKPNLSSEFNKAFTGNILYYGSWYQANFKYRKIDPGYRTLGAAFLNSGLKDITGGIGWSMLKQAMNISLNVGFQENDAEQKVIRSIYSVNAGVNAGKQMNITFNFSNFSTTTRQSQLRLDLLSDTLEYFQVTRNFSASMSYQLSQEKDATTLALNSNVQNVYDGKVSAMRLYNYSFGCQRKLGEQWQFSISATMNENVSPQLHSRSAGPVINLSRPFMEGKLRSSFSAATLNAYNGSQLQSRVVNSSLTNSFKLLKQHSFGLNLYYVLNDSHAEVQKKFSETRVVLNYNFSF